MIRSLIFLLLTSGLFAQRNGPLMLWPYVPDDTTPSNLAMSAAATYGAAGFMAPTSKTVNEIQIAISTVTGSLTTGDLRLAIYSDSSGKPGTETEGINSSGTPATGWNSITGYTTSLTAGTTYWIVWRNMDATPASNFFTIARRVTSISGYGVNTSANSGTQSAWMSASSTDSGTNWNRNAVIVPIVVVYSDGTREGFPITAPGTSCQVYASRECGLYLQTGQTTLRITGAAAMVSKTGAPTGNVRFRLYEGTANSRTLIATTHATANVSTIISYTHLWFSSPVILKARTWYTLVMSETTQSDASGNRFNLAGYAIKSDSASLFSGALGAGTQYSSSTDGGSTWADTNNEMANIAFALDSTSPFLTPSGGFAVSF